jgi:hypothetical protein
VHLPGEECDGIDTDCDGVLPADEIDCSCETSVSGRPDVAWGILPLAFIRWWR